MDHAYTSGNLIKFHRGIAIQVLGTEGYLLGSAATSITELRHISRTPALFTDDGWNGNDVRLLISWTSPSIIELLPLRAMDVIDREALQSTREGDPSNMINKLINSFFSISSIKLKKGVSMVVENMIDDLIEAGWYVLESDFDLNALSNWRKEAFECVTALMGPQHTYTQYFKDFVRGGAKTGVLAGEGILNAVKEQLGKAAGPRPCC